MLDSYGGITAIKRLLVGGIEKSNLECLYLKEAIISDQEELDKLIDIIVSSHLPLKEIALTFSNCDVSLTHKPGIRELTKFQSKDRMFSVSGP